MVATNSNNEIFTSYDESTAFDKVQLKFVNLQSSIRRHKNAIKEIKEELDYEMSNGKEIKLTEKLTWRRAMLRRRKVTLAYIKTIYKARLVAELEKVNAA